MARDYVTVHNTRSTNIDENTDGEGYLARTVYEDHELVDIGILDSEGNRVMARKRLDTIGFVRWRNG